MTLTRKLFIIITIKNPGLRIRICWYFSFMPKIVYQYKYSLLENFERGFTMGYTVAVVGATGAVGAQMIKMLEESTLPIDKIRYVLQEKSCNLKDKTWPSRKRLKMLLKADIALSQLVVQHLAKYTFMWKQAVVVDNTFIFPSKSDVSHWLFLVNAHALDAQRNHLLSKLSNPFKWW